MKDRIDVVFLGYGFCQSLQEIENEVDVPVVMPRLDDCISILLTPERYAAEKRKEVGTWFMTPGWAEVGINIVIKELHLDRAVKYGKNPVDMAKRLLTHYRRGLFIETGVGDRDDLLKKAEAFCGIFGMTLEETAADSRILEETFEKCAVVAHLKQKG